MTAKEITVEVCTKTSGSLARRVRIGITCVTISCGSAQSHKPWDYLRVRLNCCGFTGAHAFEKPNIQFQRLGNSRMVKGGKNEYHPRIKSQGAGSLTLQILAIIPFIWGLVASLRAVFSTFTRI